MGLQELLLILRQSCPYGKNVKKEEATDLYATVSLASLVILMEKALDEFASLTEQSLVSKYLQLPWKLNTFPSKVL